MRFKTGSYFDVYLVLVPGTVLLYISGEGYTNERSRQSPSVTHSHEFAENISCAGYGRVAGIWDTRFNSHSNTSMYSSYYSTYCHIWNEQMCVLAVKGFSFH